MCFPMHGCQPLRHRPPHGSCQAFRPDPPSARQQEHSSQHASAVIVRVAPSLSHIERQTSCSSSCDFGTCSRKTVACERDFYQTTHAHPSSARATCYERMPRKVDSKCLPAARPPATENHICYSQAVRIKALGCEGARSCKEMPQLLQEHGCLRFEIALCRIFTGRSIQAGRQ